MEQHIQLICYTYIPERTPGYELLSLFAREPIFRDYFERLMNLHLPYPIGYAIKQTVSGEVSFEIYLYQLDPSRKDHLQMYTAPIFPKETLQQIEPFLTEHTWEEEVFILSLNIDEAYLTGKKKEATYYFLTGPVYFFTHKVCSGEEIAYHTSDYSLAYVYPEIIEQYPEWYQKACFYQPNQYDLFLGSKDHRKRYGYYLQKISYARFLHFLCEFQYAPSLIEACTELYDDSCLFDVGFDFWNDGSLAKTMLYGIFTTHKAS